MAPFAPSDDGARSSGEVEARVAAVDPSGYVVDWQIETTTRSSGRRSPEEDQGPARREEQRTVRGARSG